MGMPNAFDERAADFSGMDGNSCLAGDAGCLLVTDVVHQAFVSVDEAGTEAAATTAVIVGTKSVDPAEPVSLTIDRPFIFLVRDLATGRRPVCRAGVGASAIVMMLAGQPAYSPRRASVVLTLLLLLGLTLVSSLPTDRPGVVGGSAANARARRADRDRRGGHRSGLDSHRCAGGVCRPLGGAGHHPSRLRGDARRLRPV